MGPPARFRAWRRRLLQGWQPIQLAARVPFQCHALHIVRGGPLPVHVGDLPPLLSANFLSPITKLAIRAIYQAHFQTPASSKCSTIKRPADILKDKKKCRQQACDNVLHDAHTLHAEHQCRDCSHFIFVHSRRIGLEGPCKRWAIKRAAATGTQSDGHAVRPVSILTVRVLIKRSPHHVEAEDCE